MRENQRMKKEMGKKKRARVGAGEKVEERKSKEEEVINSGVIAVASIVPLLEREEGNEKE